MMYATVAEFVLKHDPQKIGRMVDDTGGEETVSPTITMFLEDASAFIDSYLQARYVVPVAPVPANAPIPALRRACIIIAYHDMNERPPGSEKGKVDPEYDEIVAWLKLVQSGDADIPNITFKSDSAAVFESHSPVFDPDNFESF